MSLKKPRKKLASALRTRCDQPGKTEDLDCAISMHRKADPAISLNNLAIALSTRFDQSGKMEDLDCAISMHRDALIFLPLSHPDRPKSLSNLAIALSTRFNQSGKMEDLDCAISRHREALTLLPLGHPDRSKSLSNLAIALSTRFDQSGKMEDLDCAISMHREALTLLPLGHPGRAISLNNLIIYLSTRFDRSGRMEDLQESFTLFNWAANDMTSFEAATCWIAAEHALNHARGKISAVSQVLRMWNIQESEYVVQAGFDESLIKSGVGYLEQIHMFVSAPVDPTSPLLYELGRLFSPFPSILFTESSSYHLPVFKDDGNVWEFSELVYSTASKFADGGSSAKTPLTVISFSLTPNGSTGFLQGRSGSGGGGEKNEKRKSEKGKERDRGDEDEADNGDKNDKDPDEPEKPSAGKTNVGLPEISFEITSEIYPNQDEENTFQTLTMQGSLAIKTTPAQSPRQFSNRNCKFAALTFGTEPTTDIAYKQFHIRVVVDSHQENARIEDVNPKRSQDSDGKEKQSSSTKTGRNYGVTATATLLPHPRIATAGNAMKTNEETAGSEKMRYTSRVTEHHSDGIVRWGFNVDDVNLQERGIDMPDDVLPSVHFKFLGNSDEPAPPPERMDFVIASYWSMILPSERSWIRRFLRLFNSSASGNTPTYSNLFQIVALKTVPSNLPELSHYKATVHVRPGAPGPPIPEVKRRTASSVDVTPVVVDDLKTLSNLNDLKIAKFKLSDNCIQTLKILGSVNKSH